MKTLQKKFYKWDSKNIVKSYEEAKGNGFTIKLEYINKHYILTVSFFIFSFKINFDRQMKK